MRAALLDGPAPRAITCFEVLEHVRDLPGVVELLVELATEHDTTVVLSVPNDAFWAIENPFHETTWSAGRVRRAARDAARRPRLRRAAAAARLAHRASTASGAGAPPAIEPHEGAAASHFLAAFGPAAGELRGGAQVFEADQHGERAWTRQRETDLAYLEARARPTGATLHPRPRGPARASRVRARRPRWPSSAARLWRAVKVAFLVNDLQLSGGIGVVVQHALQLVRRHGFEVTLVLVREQDDPHWAYEPLADLHILSFPQACEERFDIAIATWWETTFSLFDVPAERYAYFVQSLEDRFYEPDAAERVGAGLTLDLPVAFITEASWIAEHARRTAARRALHARAKRHRQADVRDPRAARGPPRRTAARARRGQPAVVVQARPRRDRRRVGRCASRTT